MNQALKLLPEGLPGVRSATSVAKKLNLLRKEDRVDLFQAVLYGNAVCTDDTFDFLAKAA